VTSRRFERKTGGWEKIRKITLLGHRRLYFIRKKRGDGSLASIADTVGRDHNYCRKRVKNKESVMAKNLAKRRYGPLHSLEEGLDRGRTSGGYYAPGSFLRR